MEHWLSRRALIVAALLFLLISLATAFGIFTGLDSLATDARLRLPLDVVDWLSAPFVVAGSVGATVIVVVILTATLLRRRPMLAVGLVAAYVLANLVEVGLKLAFTHPNPPDLGRHAAGGSDLVLLVRLLTDANIGLLPQRVLLDSYPSGHTARAVLLCLVIAALWPRRSMVWAMPVFVALLVLALVLGGSHWPSDILGGACLGWLCAAVAACAPSLMPSHRLREKLRLD